MLKTPQSANNATPPARNLWSVLMLLALVLAITAQLVTGFIMMLAFSNGLLIAHVLVGMAAIVLTVAEWIWLCLAPAGRYRLGKYLTADSGPTEWSEITFLIVATATVALGALLAAILYLGAELPFGALLSIHQTLAIAVAVLYLIHSAFAIRRSRQRRLST